MEELHMEDGSSQGGDEERGGEAPGAPQESGRAKAGNSVTPGLLISGPSSWEYLASNVDTLDLSLYVDWGPYWAELFEELEKGKLAAQETGAAMFRGCETIILPSAGKAYFTWHLQRPEFHLFLTRCPEPTTNQPNASVSISARTLWERGPFAAAYMIVDWISQLGGVVNKVQISRMDVATDFEVSGGLTSGFLKQHAVCRSRKTNVFEDDDITETMYFGAKGAPILLRIYDKKREIAASPTKTWLHEVWECLSLEPIFRIEFQLRREALREYGISGLDDLSKLAGQWAHLTRKWFSLRNLDNENSTRRTAHPFWEAVQAVATKLGKIQEVHRTRFKGVPNMQRNQAQVMGHLKSFAGLLCLDGSFEEVVAQFVQHAKSQRLDQSFPEAVQLRRIKLGVPLRNSAESEPLASWLASKEGLECE